MLTRLARWWLHRKAPRPVPVEECEVCGAPADHRIVSGSDDPVLGIHDGGTLLAADFCAKHCPGRCRAGCANMAR